MGAEINLPASFWLDVSWIAESLSQHMNLLRKGRKEVCFLTHLTVSYCLALIIVSSIVLLSNVFMSDVKALMASVSVSPLLERNL